MLGTVLFRLAVIPTGLLMTQMLLALARRVLVQDWKVQRELVDATFGST